VRKGQQSVIRGPAGLAEEVLVGQRTRDQLGGELSERS
jgi:hypothetical protein